jgi:hypothetical protein
MRWAEYKVLVKERRCTCRVMVGKPDGKRSHRRTRRMWEDDTKMDL